jgi:hypothetical protein
VRGATARSLPAAGPFVGRFRCPDGRIVRMCVSDFRGAQARGQTVQRVLAIQRLSAEAGGRSSRAGALGEQQKGGRRGAERRYRLLATGEGTTKGVSVF